MIKLCATPQTTMQGTRFDIHLRNEHGHHKGSCLLGESGAEGLLMATSNICTDKHTRLETAGACTMHHTCRPGGCNCMLVVHSIACNAHPHRAHAQRAMCGSWGSTPVLAMHPVHMCMCSGSRLPHSDGPLQADSPPQASCE
jgi:hypothetical protein